MRFCASTAAKFEMMSMKVNGAVFLSNLLASGEHLKTVMTWAWKRVV